MDSVGRIGVVTVTYNSAGVLPEFLESVFAQTFLDYFLYVVDNASKDRSIEIASSVADPRVRVIINKENLGVAEGNNQGIRAALVDGCDAVLLLNNDTVFPSELFLQLRDGLKTYDCAMATPKIYYYDKPDVIWAAGGYFQPWLGYRTQHYGEKQQDTGQFDVVRAVTYAPTCCVLIHKDVFHMIGLMDPLYFVYMDDVDFMYRSLRARITLKLLPEAKLWHKVSSLTGGGTSDFMVHYCTRNRVYFQLKHFFKPIAKGRLFAYWTYHFVRLLLRKDTPTMWQKKRKALKEGEYLAQRAHANESK